MQGGIMNKYEIEIEGVPEGYVPVRFGFPRSGESFVNQDGIVNVSKHDFVSCARLIVRKVSDVRPWTFETAPTVVKAKTPNGMKLLLLLVDDGFTTLYQNGGKYSFKEVLAGFTKLDGSPCGEVIE